MIKYQVTQQILIGTLFIQSRSLVFQKKKPRLSHFVFLELGFLLYLSICPFSHCSEIFLDFINFSYIQNHHILFLSYSLKLNSFIGQNTCPLQRFFFNDWEFYKRILFSVFNFTHLSYFYLNMLYYYYYCFQQFNFIILKKIAMNVEYIHVSQLYQTVITFAIMILLVTEILAGYNKLWGHITKMRSKDRDDQLKWIKMQQSGKSEENEEAQKNAIESLRREMSEYENKGSPDTGGEKTQQPQEQTDFSINNLLGQLSNSEKSVLLFYIEYGSFMSDQVPIIMSILVVGILTSSTMIFTLACFFCFLFSSVMFDFLHLEQRLKEEYKKGIVLRRIVKILSGCFLFAIFIDYWTGAEFYTA